MYVLRYSINFLKPKNNNNNNNIVVSGNADDEKNLHQGGRKFIFVINFPDIFSFLL